MPTIVIPLYKDLLSLHPSTIRECILRKNRTLFGRVSTVKPHNTDGHSKMPDLCIKTKENPEGFWARSEHHCKKNCSTIVGIPSLPKNISLSSISKSPNHPTHCNDCRKEWISYAISIGNPLGYISPSTSTYKKKLTAIARVFVTLCSISLQALFCYLYQCETMLHNRRFWEMSILPSYLSMPPLEFHHPRNLKALYLLNKQKYLQHLPKIVWVILHAISYTLHAP